MPYTIAKYDPVSDDPDSGFAWSNVATVDRPMQLRPYIRELYAQSYSEVSVSIIEHPTEAGSSAPKPKPKPKGRKKP